VKKNTVSVENCATGRRCFSDPIKFIFGITKFQSHFYTNCVHLLHRTKNYTVSFYGNTQMTFNMSLYFFTDNTCVFLCGKTPWARQLSLGGFASRIGVVVRRKSDHLPLTNDTIYIILDAIFQHASRHVSSGHSRQSSGQTNDDDADISASGMCVCVCLCVCVCVCKDV